ncbi:MAG: hemolysin family protein [Candidatus Omnitrophota bacterium]
MLELVLLFCAVIFASFICSLSEAAVLSLPLVRARILCEGNYRNSKDLLYLKENISSTIASIVIINNAVNIIGSIFAGQMVALRFGNDWLGIASAFLTLSIILVGEIIPKTIGERFKIPLSLFFAKPLRGIVWFFRPLLAVIIRMTQPFIDKHKLPKVTEDEIRMMLKLGRDSGTVETDEEVLCNRVFKLNDLRAYQIMKPIEGAYALPENKTLAEIKEEIINSRFSRIVVYRKDPLDIVGVVQNRMLLREIAKDNYHSRVKDFMVQPVFVNWFLKADALLEKFQAYHQHLFIVEDSNGRKVGVITMEDVLEELFGEIYDEKDDRPRGLKAQDSAESLSNPDK